MAEFDRQLAAEIQADIAGLSNAAHLHLSPMHLILSAFICHGWSSLQNAWYWENMEDTT